LRSSQCCGRRCNLERRGDIIDALDAEISRGHGIEAALTGIIRSPCEETMRGALRLHIDHIERLIDIICVEYFANKVVDGKVQRMIVMRCMWDRSSWIASQQLLARMFTEIVAMPAAPHEHEERVH
jgi:hypothetical protein